MSAFWRDLDVPQSCACSLHGVRPDRSRHGICAIDATSRLGRRRQFCDIGGAVRPGQSQGALRSQRHRQRREYPAAPPQPSTTGRFLRFGGAAGAARPPRATALYRRLAADHQRAPSRPAKTAGSAAGATGGEQFHGDLPGVLAIKFAVLRGEQRGRACRFPATARNNFLMSNLFKVEFSSHAC
jgi:hypothetical protein